MGLDIFFRDDVRRKIESAYDALESVGTAGSVSADYRRGFEDALRNLAVAFGIEVGRKDKRDANP